MNREALIQEVTEEFIRHCLDRPWLSLTPDQVSAIVVDIVIRRVVEHTVRVDTGTCHLCGRSGYLELDEVLAARAIQWRRLPAQRRPFIQNSLPELTPGQREQLLNGSHEACFDAAFPDE